jgi:hypothetical protein
MNKSKNRNNWKNSVTRNWTYFFSNMYISSYFGIQNGRKKPLAIAEKTTSKKNNHLLSSVLQELLLHATEC